MQSDEVRVRTCERKPLSYTHGPVQEKANEEKGTVKKYTVFTGHGIM
jgi:hypothetical protein